MPVCVHFCLFLFFFRPQLLQVLIGLFELPPDVSTAGEDIPGAVPVMNGMEAQDDESSGTGVD
jgi:hypothetical protein